MSASHSGSTLTARQQSTEPPLDRAERGVWPGPPRRLRPRSGARQKMQLTISRMSSSPISEPQPRSASLELTSVSNPRVRTLVNLRRRRQRDQLGLMLVEGYEELTLALTAGAVPTSLYFCPELVRDAGNLHAVADVAALGTETVRVSAKVFERVAYRESPDGWLAVVPTVPTDLAALRLRPNPLALVCESVEKPGNLGAMLRTADAVGADAVIAAQPITDWGNPNIVR